LALQSLQQHLRELPANVEDGAVLVLDNASGEVLAWVGSSGGLSQARRWMACWRCASPAPRSSRFSTPRRLPKSA
jgi:hypothetical protein